MIRFVENANLPESKVAAVICGELCSELNSYLDSINVERLLIEPNKYVDPAVSFHADMAAIHLGEDKLIVDRSQRRLASLLTEKGFSVLFSNEPIKGEYPKDIALNFTVIADKVFGNFSYAEKTLTEQISAFKTVNVKQGYCKCSCLVVNENAIITDDRTIYDNALKNGLDSLFISKGDILLGGHDYGFIGGASCKISQNEILFFGDITVHRDYKKIAGFIEEHGCRIISLNFPLTDFGGIIPITEKAP